VLFPSFSSYSFAPLSHFHTSASCFSRFDLVLFSLLFLPSSSCYLPDFSLFIYPSLFSLSPFTNLSLSLSFLFLYPSHFISPFSFVIYNFIQYFFSSPPSSTSFYHFSEVFALITTKFIFPALPQRPLLIDYSSLKIGCCIKGYIYVTPLHTKIIQTENLNVGEYISRFKRQRFPAEVLLSALKEWFLFFSKFYTF